MVKETKEPIDKRVQKDKELVQDVKLAKKHFGEGNWNNEAIINSFTSISEEYNVTPQFIESLLQIYCSGQHVSTNPTSETVKDLENKVTEFGGNFAVATMVHLASCSPEDFNSYFLDLTRTAYFNNQLTFIEIDHIGRVFDIEVEPSVKKA